MFEELRTEDWFLIALAAGAGFLMVRHALERWAQHMRRGSEGFPPTQPLPRQGDENDQSTWFRRKDPWL